jgi:hypothetical protein
MTSHWIALSLTRNSAPVLAGRRLPELTLSDEPPDIFPLSPTIRACCSEAQHKRPLGK